jgi:hypothetical protein
MTSGRLSVDDMTKWMLVVIHGVWLISVFGMVFLVVKRWRMK